MVKKLMGAGIIAALFLSIYSCSIYKQAAELKTFSECTFTVNNIKVQSIAGVDVSNVKKFTDLPLNDYLTLAQQAFSKDIPSGIAIKLNVYNPSDKTASVSGLDWEMYLKDELYSTGVINKSVQVLPKGNSVFEVIADINLKDIIHSQSLPQLLKLIIEKNEQLNLSDLEAVVRIKPWYLSGKSIKKYPGFIRIKL